MLNHTTLGAPQEFEMTWNMTRTSLLLALSITLVLAVAACRKSADATPGAAQAQTSGTSAGGKGAIQQKLFDLKITPGASTVGKSTTSVVRVTPGPGYKMNTEFPVALKLNQSNGITFAAHELRGKQAQLTEKALEFKVQLTPSKAGKASMSATADFSVCNKNICKLIRGEKLSWAVDVK